MGQFRRIQADSRAACSESIGGWDRYGKGAGRAQVARASIFAGAQAKAAAGRPLCAPPPPLLARVQHVRDGPALLREVDAME